VRPLRFALLSLSLVACTDPMVRDREALERVIVLDEAFDRAMKEADDASRAGGDDVAADLLRDRAAPAGDVALRAAKSASVETAWGKQRRDELVAVIGDRKDELPKYEAALRSGDAEKKIDALKRQIELQKRALNAAASVRERR
jgi:hypothetical protein